MRGIRPQLLGHKIWQAVEECGEDRLLGGARRQVDLDLGFQLDNAGGEFDQAHAAPEAAAPAAAGPKAAAKAPARKPSAEPAEEKEANLAPLNFRVAASFRREFKTYAATHDLKLNELLRLSFDAYRRQKRD